ncbi:MAG TPA: ribonuclease III [Sphingobium sp.]|nr:ribonuclease III [Sphingobium sp.]
MSAAPPPGAPADFPAAWLETLLGRTPGTAALYMQALTHGSAGTDHYERLEFLGDRVLGLVMAQWLYTLFPHEKEGQLSRRFNQLVAGGTCAQVARECGVPAHLRLGKQARDDGAVDSDNVLGDVMEALIGALYLDHGLEAARALIERLWAPLLDARTSAPKHPKSALQEWAAANNRRPPAYELIDRSGPHHALHFTVQVSIRGAGEARGEGNSKQEAETAAAKALLAQLGG